MCGRRRPLVSVRACEGSPRSDDGRASLGALKHAAGAICAAGDYRSLDQRHYRRCDRAVGVDLTLGLFDAGRRLAADAAVFGSKSL
jgi:hypothetical protein